MSQLFLDILTFAVTTGAVLIYIHTLKAKEAKRKTIETEHKASEDRMLNILEGRFYLILETQTFLITSEATGKWVNLVDSAT
jgi:hypothetical protein